MVQKDDVDAQSVALVGIFGALVTFVLIVGVQVLFYRMEKKDAMAKVTRPGASDLKDMLAEHTMALGGYRWADRGKDEVTIPIERAMELTARERASARR